MSTVEQPESEVPSLLKPAEVATRLNVSRSFVYRLIESGELASHRIGNGRGAIRVSESDLLSFLARCRNEKQEEAPRPPRQKLKHVRV